MLITNKHNEHLFSMINTICSVSSCKLGSSRLNNRLKKVNVVDTYISKICLGPFNRTFSTKHKSTTSMEIFLILMYDADRMGPLSSAKIIPDKIYTADENQSS